MPEESLDGSGDYLMRVRKLVIKPDKTYNFQVLSPEVFFFYRHEFEIYGRKYSYNGCSQKSTKQQCPLCLREESVLKEMYAVNIYNWDTQKRSIMEMSRPLAVKIREKYSVSDLQIPAPGYMLSLETKSHGNHMRYPWISIDPTDKKERKPAYDLAKTYKDTTTSEDIYAYLKRLFGHYQKRLKKERLARKERMKQGRWTALEIT